LINGGATKKSKLQEISFVIDLFYQTMIV